MEMVILSVYFNVEAIVRHYHAYQSVSIAVGEKKKKNYHAKGRELTPRIYLQLWWRQVS